MTRGHLCKNPKKSPRNRRKRTKINARLILSNKRVPKSIKLLRAFEEVFLKLFLKFQVIRTSFEENLPKECIIYKNPTDANLKAFKGQVDPTLTCSLCEPKHADSNITIWMFNARVWKIQKHPKYAYRFNTIWVFMLEKLKNVQNLLKALAQFEYSCWKNRKMWKTC